MKNNVILSLKGITKTFPGVKALDNINIDFFEGEVHSICGENGAGKSTLMKVLSGVYSMDEGDIYINGEKVTLKSSLDALKKGQSIIFQEFNLIDVLSVAENIFLGRLSNKTGSWIDWKKINNQTMDLMKKVGYEIDPTMLVKNLSIAEKQMVEIAKALSYNSKIIIMDEPSATLTSKETEHLFKIIERLKDNKVTVIYISHKLDEIVKISDRVSIMRDGKIVSTDDIKAIDKDYIIEQMIGYHIEEEYPEKDSSNSDKEIVLKVKNLCRNGIFENISFELHKGEILGLAGLVGSGRTEIVRSIFGADKLDLGEIWVNGELAVIDSPRTAIKHGIALLTEDRKNQGLHLELTVANNIVSANLETISEAGFINEKEETSVAKKYIEELSIKTPSESQETINLSGGNQQKIVLAKWLFANSEIIILDEPTRGIDVGAKAEIYAMVKDLVKQGKSIILISSELPELLAMSDRVLVICKGRIKEELSGKDINDKKVMSLVSENK